MQFSHIFIRPRDEGKHNILQVILLNYIKKNLMESVAKNFKENIKHMNKNIIIRSRLER